ncbi:hypothetical protein JCM10449v2_000232 [Rhodotorula kratochvilovae]
MPRPSSADLLAFQLEQAAADKAGRTSPLPLSAPPSSSFGASPHFSTDSSAPSTPATPWLDGEFAAPRPSGMPVGLGIVDQPRGKLQGRGGTRAAQDEDEEQTDDELEDELNDFGYGAPRRRKEKKESLLDMLNSEPPDWMVQTPPRASIDPEPLPPAQPKRSVTLTKLRQRFGSTGPAQDSPALPAADSFSGLSTLRTSRSASNLLSSLRGRLGGGANGANRSRDDFSDTTAPSMLPGSASQSSLAYANPNDSFAAFDPLPPMPTKKLAAKEAYTACASTRDLADFLRSSGPPDTPFSEFGALPPKPSSLSLGAKPRATLHKQRPSASGARAARSAHTAASSDAGSIDATSVASGGAAIIKAAMVKLGAGGRRASLTPLAKLGISPASAAVSPPGDDERSGSSDGAGSGTIRVDDEFMAGMFGRPQAQVNGNAHPYAAATERRRRASADAASVMGVAEFVATDERRAPPHFEQQHRLPVETRAGDLVEKAAAGLYRSSSHRSSDSQSQFAPQRVGSPQRIARKPVPAAIPPIEELIVSSPPSRTSPFIKHSTVAALQALQDRGDPSPLAVGESPIKGVEVTAPQQASYQTLAPVSPVSPLTPSTAYATPPVTPTPNALDRPSPSRSRTTTSDSTLSISAASNKRLSLVAAAAAARPPSPAPETPLPAPPHVRTRTTSLQRHKERPEGLVLAAAARQGAKLSAPPALHSPAQRVFAPSSAGAGAPSPLAASTPAAERAHSPDSLLDPPLTAGLPPAPEAASAVGPDAALLAALGALQACLVAAAAATLPPSAGLAGAEGKVELVTRVVPVLRGMGEQMRLGAKLVEEVLARLQEGQREEEEGEEEVRRVAEALLDAAPAEVEAEVAKA